MTGRNDFRALRALTLCAGLAVGGPAGAATWDRDYFTNAPLVTQDGETVAFYDDLIADRIVVINFIYTECPDICSLSTSRMAEIADALGDRMGRDVFFYSISLDPETDTPEKLAEYAQAFDVGSGWLFLTGQREDIDLVRYKLGERSRSLTEHRSDMVVGNGATGAWRRMSVMSDIEIALESILQMDPVYRDTQHTVDAEVRPAEDYVIPDRPGEALYLTLCSSCHTVGFGDKIGPDLAGVADRREHDWLVRFLMVPDALRRSGDPLALEIDARYPGVRMPDLGLGELDAADLVTYLAAQTALLRTEAAPLDGGEDHDHAAHDHASHVHSNGH